jgi:hypothetical protein
LAAMGGALLGNGGVAAVGRAGIGVFSLGLAAIFFQDAIEAAAGIGPRWIESAQSAMEKSTPESTAAGAVYLLTGVGIYRWKRWGPILGLGVCIGMVLGIVGYAWAQGFSVKLAIAFVVLAGVILWLWHPDVRHRFEANCLR